MNASWLWLNRGSAELDEGSIFCAGIGEPRQGGAAKAATEVAAKAEPPPRAKAQAAAGHASPYLNHADALAEAPFVPSAS